MPDEILSRDEIAHQANVDAMQCARTGREVANRYAPGTDAAKCWDAAYNRYLLKHTSPDDTDGGA